MVTWERAWRAAGAWLGWSLIWGIIGIIFIGTGVFVSIGSLNNSILGGYAVYAMGGLVSGLVLIVIGSIISALAGIASFFKINSEITAEEVKSQMHICPTCDSPLRFIPKYQKWYCDKEEKYV
jgi:hypothetical protein